MAIELTCEKCGRPLSVPREQAGRRTQCPHCNNDIYVPTPEEEIEELPLAPEDSEALTREQQLQAERLRIDRILAQAGTSDEDTEPPQPGTRPAPARTARTSVKDVVMSYLVSMRKSDLARAEKALALLAARRSEALRIVDELIADQIPPAEMTDVPPPVYQGFLKTLRSRLS